MELYRINTIAQLKFIKNNEVVFREIIREAKIAVACGYAQRNAGEARTMAASTTRTAIMNRHLFISAVSLAGLLAISGGVARADIIKCVDAEGHVTLTDQDCPRNEAVLAQQEVAAVVPMADVPDQAPRAQVTRVVLSADAPALPPKSWESTHAHPAPTRSFALDAATLKAARVTMQLLDAQTHQQKMASLR